MSKNCKPKPLNPVTFQREIISSVPTIRMIKRRLEAGQSLPEGTLKLLHWVRKKSLDYLRRGIDNWVIAYVNYNSRSSAQIHHPCAWHLCPERSEDESWRWPGKTARKILTRLKRGPRHPSQPTSSKWKMAKGTPNGKNWRDACSRKRGIMGSTGRDQRTSSRFLAEGYSSI